MIGRLIRRIGHISTKSWLVTWSVIVFLAAVVLWIAFPTWLTCGESGSTTLRNMGLLVGAAIGLPLAIWRSTIAARQADATQRQSEIAARNLLNERFQRGAEMLGHPEIGSVRIGGIHALARLGREYPDTFHLPVMQLFAAFVVDRTRGETVEQGIPVPDSATPGKEEPENTAPVTSRNEQADTDEDFRHPLESSSAEFKGPFFAADREVGPVPELAKDVMEAMRLISQRDRDQIELEGKEGFRMDLADVSLPGLVFHKANFSNFDFTKADLRRVRAWDTCFSNAGFPGADLSGANMHGADFRGADMRRVNLTAARLTGADLRKADLGPVDWAGQNLWRGKWFPSKLVGAQLQGADLRGADLGNADLSGANLGCAKLDGAFLSKARLAGADLRAASLKDADLSGVDLTNANLGGAGADLSDAHLVGASLKDTNLGSANLSGANLAEAEVSGADFSRDWMYKYESPASGLTQEQLDQAKADPSHPPVLDGVLDSKTNKPLVWNGQCV